MVHVLQVGVGVVSGHDTNALSCKKSSKVDLTIVRPLRAEVGTYNVHRELVK